MDDRARVGRWVLLGVVATVAVIELSVDGLLLWAGRFRAAHAGRAVVTGWLLWQVWAGAGWARWLLSALLGAGSAAALVLAFGSQAAEGRPDAAALAAGFWAVFAALSVALMSPWVAAYQAARRAGVDA